MMAVGFPIYTDEEIDGAVQSMTASRVVTLTFGGQDIELAKMQAEGEAKLLRAQLRRARDEFRLKQLTAHSYVTTGRD